jgi:acetolactate synthase-1/2/3 large subunit
MRRVGALVQHLATVSPAPSSSDEAAVEASPHPGVAHWSDPSSGARTLIRTLVANDCTVCFTNPGTSEMHFVAGLDSETQMRPILVLQENVATGAADGYARMAGKPASTLLHLAPGMANGYANLHNARKNRTPMINVIGDHATFHKPFDAPLNSDIEALSESLKSGTEDAQFFRTTSTVAEIVDDACDAVVAAGRGTGQVATLILPANVSWADNAPRSVHSPCKIHAVY